MRAIFALPTRLIESHGDLSSHLYSAPDGPCRLSTTLVNVKFEMSIIHDAASPRPGKFETDIVAGARV